MPENGQGFKPRKSPSLSFEDLEGVVTDKIKDEALKVWKKQ